MKEKTHDKELPLITNVDDIPESTVKEFEGAKGDDHDESCDKPSC